MSKKLKIAAAIALVVAVFALLIPFAASTLGNPCEFGPCAPSMLSR